jgi:hypothetical protein
MFYVFLLIVATAGVAIYLLFILREVPGAAEERLGALEALPPDVGQWKEDPDSPEGKAAIDRGELREVRSFYASSGGSFGGGKLLKQVRYRSAETNEIVRAEPDRRVKRKRIRQRGSEPREPTP